MRWRHLAALLATAMLAIVTSGWVSANGLFNLGAHPPPEGTIRPKPDSWNHVHPPRGYRVVLLTAGDDRPTTTLVTAVRQWAQAEHVSLETVAVRERDSLVSGIVEAMERKPDLIVCAGNALIDPLALVTASHLDRQFLIVGAQLPEPTANVTAAIWQGASSRGTEVPNTVVSFDPDAFTAERASAAIRAGVASVLQNLTGVVVSLE